MMGRGKKWSSEERERVAIAWSRATHDPVVGHNQSGDTFDEKAYSLFSRKPPKDADPGTYNNRSHPSVMTCFHNNISPDVMKFIGVLWMVKGVGLSGMTAEELLRIAVRQHRRTSQAMIVPQQLHWLMLFLTLLGRRNSILVETPQNANYSWIKKDRSRPSCYLR